MCYNRIFIDQPFAIVLISAAASLIVNPSLQTGSMEANHGTLMGDVSFGMLVDWCEYILLHLN